MEETCRICYSAKNSPMLTKVNDYLTNDQFTIVKCNTCGVGFTTPQPSNMDKYYPTEYRRYTKFALLILKTLYKWRVNNWLRSYQKPGRVLEIGCGAGFMLDVLRKKGWQVNGVERSEAMINYAKETLGEGIVYKSLAHVPDNLSYDLIILFQVLEHLDDPLSILKQCAAKLKPGGTIIINVPNIASWQANYAGKDWLHLDAPRHVFHFDPQSLTTVLKMVGLKTQNINFISFEHDPYGWIESIISKLTGNANLLTQYLMGHRRFNFKAFLLFLLGAVLTIPAFFLSFLSWGAKKGALMQVIAKK